MCLALTVLVTVMVPLQTATGGPIQIGNSKQLFIDDFVIDSLNNLTKTVHHPERYHENPVLTGTEPWERWLLEVNGRPVLYDEETQEFKMWYGAHLIDRTAPSHTRFKVCYAVSKDAVHWTRPNLGQVEWEGSGNNNILKWGENWMRRPNVIKDLQDPDPDRRFKMTYVDVIGGRTAIAKAYSKDGIHWQLNGDGKPWFRAEHNSNLLGWDPRSGKYVIYPRVPGPPTSDGQSASAAIGRSTSTDFVTWSEPQTVLAPTSADRGKDFKGLAAFVYGDVYLGFLWVFERNQTADAELAFSRDCLRWQRISPGEFFFRRGPPGSWDSEMILPVAPVVFADKIWIYYSGWNLPYTEQAMERAQAGWVEDGRRMQRAIGLATLRLDGFVSLDAGEQLGTLTTKALEVPGGRLMVNAAVRRELRAEILDDSAKVLPGYSVVDCEPIRADGIEQTIRWKGKPNLNALRGKSIKLRFLLSDGSLYAFWFDRN